MSAAPKRSALRYHGGKWAISQWIVSHFPEHRIYVEPYGGGGSILFRKKRVYCEVYNDLDSEIVNFFRVVRDQGPELKEKLRLTPFSREEYFSSEQKSDNPLEQARRTAVRSFQGWGSGSIHSDSGFRANSGRNGTVASMDWKNYAEKFDAFIERIRGVTIENKDALDVMQTHDKKDTLHYVDPPYILETRSDLRHDYRYEMTLEDHDRLLKYLKTVNGHVIISGYEHELYNDMLSGWDKEKKDTWSNIGARQECLWLSPGIINQGKLF